MYRVMADAARHSLYTVVCRALLGDEQTDFSNSLQCIFAENFF